MRSIALAAPQTYEALLCFGNGNRDRAKVYLLALYNFLAGKPENTARAYQFAIREFFELWDWKSPEAIAIAEAAYYKKHLLNQEKSCATVYQRLTACRSYFEFLKSDTATKAFIVTNPFEMVTRKDLTGVSQKRSRPMTHEQLRQILKSIPEDVVGKRDLAIILFFMLTGRRRTETTNLRVRDLNLKSTPKTYRVRVQGKNTRFVLPDIVYDAIREHWLSANRLHDLRPDSAVFSAIHKRGSYKDLDRHRCMSVNTVVQILKTNAKRAGIDPKDVHLHGIRHLFAQSSARLPDIQVPNRRDGALPIYIGKLEGSSPSVEKQLRAIRAKAAAEAEAALA